MDAYVIPAATSLLIPAAYLLVTARREFWRAVLLWLIWPIITYCTVMAWEMLTRSPGPGAFSDALLGLSLLSAILILPWLLFSGLVLGLAVAIRSVFRGPEPSPAKPERVVVPQEPIAQYEAGYAGERKVSDERKQTSPDGTIAVEFEPVEWYNNLWMFPPRITDVNSGDVVLDAWGQDWDVRVEFPATVRSFSNVRDIAVRRSKRYWILKKQATKSCNCGASRARSRLHPSARSSQASTPPVAVRRRRSMPILSTNRKSHPPKRASKRRWPFHAQC